MTTPPAATSEPAPNPAVTIAHEQQKYYDASAAKNRRGRFIAEYVTITLAWLLTVVPAIGTPNIFITAIGATAAAVLTIKGLHQWSYHWMTQRITAEQLRWEIASYDTKSGPYADNPAPDRTLTERVKLIAGTENAGWAANQSTANAQVRRPDPA